LPGSRSRLFYVAKERRVIRPVLNRPSQSLRIFNKTIICEFWYQCLLLFWLAPRLGRGYQGEYEWN
jgi:hypothetical protein